MPLTKDAVELYSGCLRQRGLPQSTTFHENETLRDGTVGLTDAQLQWAVFQWLDQTAMPAVNDFFQFLHGVGELPSDCGARAALSPSEYVQRLGEELEELSGAWYPTEETKLRIAELEARIREAT